MISRGDYPRGGMVARFFRRFRSPRPENAEMVDKLDSMVPPPDIEEQLEDASASPTEDESVETMRRVPIMDEEREDSTGWGSKMRGNVKLCGREMPVARRTAYLCTVPLIVALAVLAGCLVSYIVIIKTARVPDVLVTSCKLTRAWVGEHGMLNAQVDFEALIINNERRDAIIRGGMVRVLYDTDARATGIEVAQAILDRKALPARATTTQSKSIILHNVQSLPDGIGQRLVMEATHSGNSTLTLHGDVPFYVGVLHSFVWLPATLQLDCVIHQTWGHDETRVTTCNNRFKGF